MTERIIEALNRLGNALVNLANHIGKSIMAAFKPLIQNSKKRVSYNAKYHKITDNRKLEIELFVQSMGSNEHCYYSKMER